MTIAAARKSEGRGEMIPASMALLLLPQKKVDWSTWPFTLPRRALELEYCVSRTQTNQEENILDQDAFGGKNDFAPRRSLLSVNHSQGVPHPRVEVAVRSDHVVVHLARWPRILFVHLGVAQLSHPPREVPGNDRGDNGSRGVDRVGQVLSAAVQISSLERQEDDNLTHEHVAHVLRVRVAGALSENREVGRRKAFDRTITSAS